MPPKAAPSFLSRAFAAGKVIAQKTKIISTALKHAGFSTLAKHAAIAGYGRKKKRRVARR